MTRLLWGRYMAAVRWMLLKTVQVSRAQSHSSEHWCFTTPLLCSRLGGGSHDLGLWVMVSVWTPTRGGVSGGPVQHTVNTTLVMYERLLASLAPLLQEVRVIQLGRYVEVMCIASKPGSSLSHASYILAFYPSKRYRRPRQAGAKRWENFMFHNGGKEQSPHLLLNCTWLPAWTNKEHLKCYATEGSGWFPLVTLSWCIWKFQAMSSATLDLFWNSWQD